MKVYRNLDTLPSFKNTAITIGSFDGIHTGHQKILKRLKKISTQNNLEHVVVTFYPHPRSIVYPKDKTLVLLSSLQEKIDLFKKFGVEHLVIVPFTIEFSQMTANEYIEGFLVKYFKPKFIVIGYDHKFGSNRSGDIHLLKTQKEKFNFDIIEIPKQEIDEITISSTKIRNAISRGELSNANLLLNHPYTISGTVITGRKLGTKIGFPTANISIEHPLKLVPKDGIYACQVLHQKDVYNGMLYIGDIPTIGTDNPKSVEVNIFDFDKDIYNERVTIEVLHYLRDDQKFDGLVALKQQLAIDRENSLAFFDSFKKNTVSKATVAILNYNTRSLLENFLPSVQYSSANDFDILVIDNASKDDSVDFVNEWFPEIKTVQLSENLGYAGGYNKGLKDVETEYFVLLNSDVQVNKNWLDPLLQYLDTHKDVAAVMPKIKAHDAPDSFEYAGAAGGHLDYLGYPFCRGRIFDELEKDNGQYDDTQDIFWASGAAFVIRKTVFEKLRGFDASYFAHQEEIDLCWRIQRAGYRIVYIPESEVFHIGGGSLNYDNPRKAYLNFKNSLTTVFKNDTGLNLLWKIPARILLDFVAAFKFIASGKFSFAWAIIKAEFAFLVSIFGLVSKRQQIKRDIKEITPRPQKANTFNKSIVMQYYLKGKKTYSELIK